MTDTDEFLKNPSPDKLYRLKKDDLIVIGKKLDLEVRGAMRKSQLMRIIAEHMVDNDRFDEEVLEDLPAEKTTMTPDQVELEKARIMAKAEVEKARIEQEIRMSELSIAHQPQQVRQNRFDITKQVRLVPKFVEKEADDYFAHFERTALNMGWPQECWAMLLQTALSGKAQKTYAALPAEDCADYEVVKEAILKSY